MNRKSANWLCTSGIGPFAKTRLAENSPHIKKKSKTLILAYHPDKQSDPASCPTTGLFVPWQGNELGREQAGRQSCPLEAACSETEQKDLQSQ